MKKNGKVDEDHAVYKCASISTTFLGERMNAMMECIFIKHELVQSSYVVKE